MGRLSQNSANDQLPLYGFETSTSHKPNYRTFKNGIIFTIGHSNKSMQEFVSKLRENGIDRLVDVRTKPYSRWYPWFNREELALTLAEADINYDFRGHNLGGLGINTRFDETVEELSRLSHSEVIALCCSEADHKKCHRYLTLTPAFTTHGLEVLHISYK